MAQRGSAQAAKNIVLVHGAFVDDSSWSKVIPLLKAKGFNVTAVGNPLTSFADDVAATKRALAAQNGPTVLVGHSYGGVVITEAGNDPTVVSLVYIAAFCTRCRPVDRRNQPGLRETCWPRPIAAAA